MKYINPKRIIWEALVAILVAMALLVLVGVAIRAADSFSPPEAHPKPAGWIPDPLREFEA